VSAVAAFAGVALAIAVALFARVVGFDRERVFYPVVLVVVGSYYDLFAVMAGGQSLIPELIGSLIFAAIAAIGFRTSLWIVAAGLAGHGIFDAFHGVMIDNAGVPNWWPLWCLSYDVAAAGCLAVLLVTGGVSERATRSA